MAAIAWVLSVLNLTTEILIEGPNTSISTEQEIIL